MPVTAPRFTVVVPVYNVQGYLRQCLDSVLHQRFADWEVVAVDDASTDHSAAIVDEYAAAHERIRAVHLPANTGLSNARNVGLDAARGEYVVLLDADDWLHPDALATLDARATKTQADVIVFDFVRTYWDSRTRPNPHADVLRSGLPESFTLQEHPEILQNLWVAWNKAYRREFVEQQGRRFFPGFYEDVSWSYPVLMTAERISVVGRVLYYYRQRQGTAITKTAGRHHFDAFTQYRRVFEFLAERGLDDFRPVVADRMADHLLKVLLNEKRISEGDRREFFAGATALYREVVPGGHVPALSPEAHDLFRRGSYRALRRHGRAEARRARRETPERGPEGRGARARDTLERKLKRLLYKAVFLRFPVDDGLAVFAAYWYRGYACNPAAVYEKLLELGGGRFRGVWIVRDVYAADMPEGVPYVVEGSLRFHWTVARAKYFVNNIGYPLTIDKRPGTVYLQTQHGTPLKTMGLDQVPYAASTMRLNFRGLLKRVNRWDYLVSSNQLSSEVWSRVYPGRYKLLEYGYPRNDVFFGHDAGLPAAVRAELGIPSDKTAVLYAPTHRDYAAEFTLTLDLARVAEAVGDEFVVLVRAHYFYETADVIRDLQDQGAVVDVSAYPDVQRLCLASDLLVTDYSSIMFDYANLGLPIVVHADDWETYQKVRGVTFDLLAQPPGPVSRDEDELIEVLRSREYESKESARRLAAFRQRFCAFEDGRAAERVVRRVFLGEKVRRAAPTAS